MERYRVIYRDKENKTVTLKSDSGKNFVVNEGLFRDAYMKLKDTALRLVKKGRDLVTYIGNKAVELVTPVHTALANGKGIYVELSDEMKKLAEESGVPYDDSIFSTHIEEEISEEFSDENVMDLVKRMVGLTMLSVEDGKVINEAESVLFAYDEPHGAKNSRIQRSDGKIKGDDLSQIEDGVRLQPLRSWVEGIPDYGYDELLELIEQKIDKIFNNEITGTSAMTCADDFPDSYTPAIITGAPGIGKTQIIWAIKEKYQKKLGKHVNFLHLMGNTMTPFSVSAPGIQFEVTYEKDEYGNPMFDMEDKSLITHVNTDSRRIYDTVNGNIPSFTPEKYFDVADSENAKLAEALNIDSDEKSGYGILFIDEVGKIKKQDVLSAISQLVQQRNISGHYLGTHWAIVLATNFPNFNMEKLPDDLTELSSNEDKKSYKKKVIYGGTKYKEFEENIMFIMKPKETSASLNARFDAWNYVPTYERWREWAEKKGVNKLILDFLDSPVYRFQWYNTFDKVADRQKLPSPRDWVKLSERFDDLEKEYGGNYLSLKDATQIKKFIESVIKVLQSKGIVLGKNNSDMKNFLEDNLILISEKDCKNAWVDPAAITFDKEDRKGIKRKYCKNIRLNASGRVISISPEELESRVYSNKPKLLTINKKEDIYEFSKNCADYLDNLADFICNYYGEYMYDEQTDTYKFRQQTNKISKLGGQRTITQNMLHSGHSGQAYTFVENIVNDFMRDIRNADPSGIYTPSMFFASISTLDGHEKDPRSDKFAVLFTKALSSNKVIS